MTEVLNSKPDESSTVVEAKPIPIENVKEATITGVETEKKEKDSCECSFLSYLNLQWIFPSRQPAVGEGDGDFTEYFETPEEGSSKEESSKEEVLIVEVPKTPEKAPEPSDEQIKEAERPISLSRTLSMSKQETVLYSMSPQKIPPTDLMFELKPDQHVSAADAAKIVKESLDDPFVLIGWQVCRLLM
jgi:hypothetical protein